MSDDDFAITIREGPATSFGWMRRAELERPGIHVWEAPDGALTLFPASAVPLIRHAVWPRDILCRY